MNNSDYIVDLSKFWDYNIHLIHKESYGKHNTREWLAKAADSNIIKFYCYGSTPKEALDKLRKKINNVESI